MPTTPDVSYIKQFADNFEFLYQQENSMLYNTLRHETQAGKEKYFDFIGATQGQRRTERNPATPNIAVPHSRRRCTLVTWDWGTTIDDVDIVKMLKNPKSQYTRSAAAAFGRFTDEIILEALGADVYAGEEGATTVHNYDDGECRLLDGDGSIVTAGSDHSTATETGLTLTKIAQCQRFLDNASIPQTGRHLVANVDQKTYLLGSTKATSYDYANIKALVRGDIDSYLGFLFHWVPNDRFTENSADSGCYECYAYHEDAIMLSRCSSPNGEKTRVTEDPTHVYNTQIYMMRSLGALRLQGPGVVEILLDKDPAIDFTQT